MELMEDLISSKSIQNISYDMTNAVHVSLDLLEKSNNSNTVVSSETKEDLSTLGYTICAIVLFLIMLLGFINNLFVILSIAFIKNLRTPLNLILLNLSVSDFIVSAIGTPLSFFSALHRKWIFGEFLCKLCAFLMTLTGMTAIGTITAIAIERYIIISRSMHGHILSVSTAKSVIIGIWIYALSQSLPPFFGWNNYVVEHPGIACSLDWQTSGISSSSFIIYIFIFGYILPVCTISFCYVKVVWILRMCPKLNGRSCTARAEIRVTIMTSVMIVCTLVAWTPYAVVSLMVFLGFENLLGPAAYVSPAVFAKSSAIYNPIVYFLFNSQIRETVLEKVSKGWQKPRSSYTDISLETRRGVNIVNTVVSCHVLGNGTALSQNL